MSDGFDLEKLIRDVFAPAPDERVLVMVDVPHDQFADHADWADRRQFAEEWREGFAKLGLYTHPLLAFPATGASNSDLPLSGMLAGRPARIEDLLADSQIAVAMTQFSATAPLVAFTRKYPNLRAASMPNVLRRMTRSALAADYNLVAMKARVLADMLTDATEANVLFTTGHEMLFDLRFRSGLADDGICSRMKVDHRVINLPSGEAFIVPYEGERPGELSRTRGILPVRWKDDTALLHVEANRITEIEGGAYADSLRAHFEVDPARRNIAELGLGCNDDAVVLGSVLEDEKAGFHWAYGRSEHLGGVTGPDAFQAPGHVVHHDIVYADGCPLTVRSVTLVYPDARRECILRNNRYTLWPVQEKKTP